MAPKVQPCCYSAGACLACAGPRSTCTPILPSVPAEAHLGFIMDSMHLHHLFDLDVTCCSDKSTVGTISLVWASP